MEQPFELGESGNNSYLDQEAPASISRGSSHDEIEIIEDTKEDKPIEKIRQFCEYPCSDKYECWSIKEDILVNKINEIIDEVNKLKKEKENE